MKNINEYQEIMFILMRIAIATEGYKGLNDKLSDVFARTPTITIIEVDRERKNYEVKEVIKNEAVDFSHGAGPIFVRTLIDKNIDIVIGVEIGVGTKELLEEKKIRFIKFKLGTKVSEIVTSIIKEI